MTKSSCFAKFLLFFALIFLLLVNPRPCFADFGEAQATKAPLNGEGKQDPFSGAFHYRVPIDVPSGRGGMKPDLAISYVSNLENGWLGAGWGLNVGAIVRNTRFGVDYGADSYILQMPFASVELINIGNNEYRAKVESDWLRIERLASVLAGMQK